MATYCTKCITLIPHDKINVNYSVPATYRIKFLNSSTPWQNLIDKTQKKSCVPRHQPAWCQIWCQERERSTRCCTSVRFNVRLSAQLHSLQVWHIRINHHPLRTCIIFLNVIGVLLFGLNTKQKRFNKNPNWFYLLSTIKITLRFNNKPNCIGFLKIHLLFGRCSAWDSNHRPFDS